MQDRLWAKSLPNDWSEDDPRWESIFLPGHLQDVHRAAMKILDATGDEQLRALRLDPNIWRERFRRVVLLAAAVHDLGKASANQFQRMIKAKDKSQVRQALRHEWITLLILDEPGWTDWLMPALRPHEDDWHVMRWAIAGHHPKYGRSAPPAREEGLPTVQVLLEHDDVKAIIDWLRKSFSLAGSPPTKELRFSLTFEEGNALDEIARRHYEAEDRFDDSDLFGPDESRFVAAVKNCLIAADVAGSALPKDVPDAAQRANWIGEVLDRATLPTSIDYRTIIARSFEEKDLPCEPETVEIHLRDFQKDIVGPNRRDHRVTFVKAGCGTGKTIGAYWWGADRCAGRRLFVCYPTTGTATEGFRDYLMDPELAEVVKTDLVHGRRSVDFRLLQADEDRNDALARISSLDIWRTPVVACTVDTVLGIIQNNRRGLFSWPALAQGGFVFDEIHSYDDKLFDALLHFLAAVRGAPILLMTASLQSNRLEAIRSTLDSIGEELAEVPGPVELERAERYQWRSDVKQKDMKAIDALIREEAERDGKVLYVCNTVGEALRTAERLKDAKPLIYHSRFRYRDRVRQHKAVVDAFRRDRKERSLAICTQVSEMSLDLSATLLVTAMAPVPSLIQRLGRLNRVPEPTRVRPFVVIEPTGADGKYSPLPYEQDDLEMATKWLERLGDKPLTQRDLADEWEAMTDAGSQVLPPRWQSAWLDYGPATPVLELREGSPSVTVILEEDLPKLRNPHDETELADVALPMPIQPNDKWQLRNESTGRPVDFNGVPVAKAESIDYDATRGAKWA